ncbi:early nodulin-related protein [Prunus dulcis]|uniref:Early nodulin-related protein n=1 Tax=Prunus dulcis TaxID=3755 RepID=A0A4Y1RXL2_PRUDU|nr:early nodulin-related protein [Prunus dulcis]
MSSYQLFIYLLQITMAKNVAPQSPFEKNSLTSIDQLALAKRCSHEGVKAGAKAAVVATIATAIPTENVNFMAVAGMAYFIVADKTVLATARRNSFKQAANREA